VFIVSPISAISFLKEPSSPTATGPQWEAGAEVGNDAELTLVGWPVREEPVESCESRTHAGGPVRAGRKPPCRDHLVADIFMDVAAGFGDGERHVGDKAVEQIEITQLAETLGDGGRGAQVDEEEGPLLDPGIVVAPGGEGEEHAAAEEIIDAEQEIRADHKRDRKQNVAPADIPETAAR
jgi:hypothetical protein